MPKEGDKITVKEIDHESWAQGYRTAIWDLTPQPQAPIETGHRPSGFLLGYFFGILVAYLIFKFSSRE